MLAVASHPLAPAAPPALAPQHAACILFRLSHPCLSTAPGHVLPTCELYQGDVAHSATWHVHMAAACPRHALRNQALHFPPPAKFICILSVLLHLPNAPYAQLYGVALHKLPAQCKPSKDAQRLQQSLCNSLFNFRCLASRPISFQCFFSLPRLLTTQQPGWRQATAPLWRAQEVGRTPVKDESRQGCTAFD